LVGNRGERKMLEGARFIFDWIQNIITALNSVHIYPNLSIWNLLLGIFIINLLLGLFLMVFSPAPVLSSLNIWRSSYKKKDKYNALKNNKN
jgi:hypothetical protein